ncbi:MAG: ATP-binding protein, partial [Elioraea sp.]|nr:ATP-binding protein [Elioraea sp.]
MSQDTAALLLRLVEALERLAPPPPPLADLARADAYVWHPERGRLAPVPRVAAVPLELLKGIERQRDLLLENTRRFARGLPANNALLWGARGMGKSSLVKAVHAQVNEETRETGGLVLVEIHREDIRTLPTLMSALREAPRRCLLFCDDLSFDPGETDYKSLKAVLEGGVEGR